MFLSFGTAQKDAKEKIKLVEEKLFYFPTTQQNKTNNNNNISADVQTFDTLIPSLSVPLK